MAKNMQQWDGEEYAMMGWQRICNDGMAALNMQQWDGKICNDGIAALNMQ